MSSGRCRHDCPGLHPGLPLPSRSIKQVDRPSDSRAEVLRSVHIYPPIPSTMLSKLLCFSCGDSKTRAGDTDTPLPPLESKTQTSSSSPSPTPPETHTFNGSNKVPAGRSRSRTLILDLGDVLFHYSASQLTTLSRSDFGAVILSPAYVLTLSCTDCV